MTVQLEQTERPFDLQSHRLLGRHAGLVNGLYMPIVSRGFDIKSSHPKHCQLHTLADLPDEPSIQAAGKGETVRQSFMSSIGEFAERYCMCFGAPVEFRYASHDELRSEGRSVIDFEHLDIYDPDGEVEPPGRDTELPWGRGVNLLTGEKTSVPAGRIWFNQRLHRDPAALLPTSNGAAAGPTLEDALLGSLYELIERDGFMRHWCRQEPPQRVDFTEYPAVRELVDEHVHTRSMTYELWTYDGPIELPTFGAALVHEDDEWPKFLMGGGSHCDAATAMRDAIQEPLQGVGYVGEPAIKSGLSDLDPGNAGTSFTDNMLYYSLPENFEELDPLLVGDRTVPDYADRTDWSTREQLEHCLSLLDSASYTPIAFDLTTPDMRELDLYVSKVFVPELVPLTPPSTLPTNHPAFDGEEVTGRAHPYP